MSINDLRPNVGTGTDYVAMTDEQLFALEDLCQRYRVGFDRSAVHTRFDLPEGYVAMWVGGDRLYVGVSPEGDVSS